MDQNHQSTPPGHPRAPGHPRTSRTRFWGAENLLRPSWRWSQHHRGSISGIERTSVSEDLVGKSMAEMARMAAGRRLKTHDLTITAIGIWGEFMGESNRLESGAACVGPSNWNGSLERAVGLQSWANCEFISGIHPSKIEPTSAEGYSIEMKPTKRYGLAHTIFVQPRLQNGPQFPVIHAWLPGGILYFCNRALLVLSEHGYAHQVAVLFGKLYKIIIIYHYHISLHSILNIHIYIYMNMI